MLNLSELNKTWLIDLDGTIFRHNGYQIGEDILLTGVKEFFDKISDTDHIIILTSRSNKYKEITLTALKKANIKFNTIIFNLPLGERICINDIKPTTRLKTAVAINVERDKGLQHI
jgi:hypothetical protein